MIRNQIHENNIIVPLNLELYGNWIIIMLLLAMIVCNLRRAQKSEILHYTNYSLSFTCIYYVYRTSVLVTGLKLIRTSSMVTYISQTSRRLPILTTSSGSSQSIMIVKTLKADIYTSFISRHGQTMEYPMTLVLCLAFSLMSH